VRKRRLTAKHAFTAWAAVVYAFLFLPILVMAVFAFNKPSPAALAGFHGSNICGIPPAQIGNITVWNGFTSCWFSAGLHDPTYIPAIVTSLQIAAVAAIIATVLGLAVDYSPLDPIKALFWSAVVNGVVAAPIMAMIMLMASRKKVMRAPWQPSQRCS
jgi:ABC-type spermidine/putrescine transport system permease subunit II